MAIKDEKRDTILYNAVFPFWFLWLYPYFWFFTLPLNFLIDSLALWIGLKLLGIPAKKGVYKNAILKIWLLGFAADIVGAAWVALPFLVVNWIKPPLGEGPLRWLEEQLVHPTSFHPFETLPGFLWVTLGVALAGFLIYIFNRKISLGKLDLTERQKKRLSLFLAIFTTPYIFYLPMTWFF